MRTRRFVQLIIALGSAVLAAPAAAAPANLGAFWQLDESAGTTALDGSGHGNHGALSGPQRVPGRFGGGLALDGGDDEVRVARSASLEPGTVTVEAWVRSPASPGPYRHIVAKGASACDAASYGLYTGEGDGLAFYVSDGTAWSALPLLAA